MGRGGEVGIEVFNFTRFGKFGCEIRGGVFFVWGGGGAACDIQKKHVHLLFFYACALSTMKHLSLVWKNTKIFLPNGGLNGDFHPMGSNP